jgi:hypothetical protein
MGRWGLGMWLSGRDFFYHAEVLGSKLSTAKKNCEESNYILAGSPELEMELNIIMHFVP